MNQCILYTYMCSILCSYIQVREGSKSRHQRPQRDRRRGLRGLSSGAHRCGCSCSTSLNARSTMTIRPDLFVPVVLRLRWHSRRSRLTSPLFSLSRKTSSPTDTRRKHSTPARIKKLARSRAARVVHHRLHSRHCSSRATSPQQRSRRASHARCSHRPPHQARRAHARADQLRPAERTRAPGEYGPGEKKRMDCRVRAPPSRRTRDFDSFS
ncbi:hypothetical protein FB451DRAFT_380950 [Mycena latifolia]|nr:hypothetical protein FB451DRAFT_380950 [Mycena latifolia]